MAKSNRQLFGALGAPETSQEPSAPAPRARTGGYLEGRQNRLEQVARGEVQDKRLLLVDPARCRMWEQHNRRYDLLNESRCADLLEGLKSQGRQEFPAIVRRLEADSEFDYEVVCGARRHWCISWLRAHNYRDFRFLIEVRKLSDEEAFRLSDVENRDREDISDYERAVDYRRALGLYYDTQKAMAERMQVSQSWLSEYLDLASLPEEVVDAFASVADIRKEHSRQLKPLLKDRRRRTEVLQRARDLRARQGKLGEAGEPRLDGVSVVRALTASGRRVKAASKPEVDVLLTASGKKALEVTRRGNRLTLSAFAVADADASAVQERVAAALNALYGSDENSRS